MNSIETSIIGKIISCKYRKGSKLDFRNYYIATELNLQHDAAEVVEAINSLVEKGLVKISGEFGSLPIIETLYCSDDYRKHID